MGARFIEYPQGLAEAMVAPAMQEAIRRKLERAKVYAEAIAPVLTGLYSTGFILVAKANREHVSASGNIRVRRRRKLLPHPDGAPGGFHVAVVIRNGRVVGLLWNPTRYAAFLEFGTRYMRARHILGRTADALRMP